MSDLTQKEQQELVKLMNKVSLPAPLEIFETWCRVFGTVCAEVVVIRNSTTGPEIFLTYREDKFVKGWHIPGKVHLPSETLDETVARVLDSEIKIPILNYVFIKWFERPYGRGVGECPRGHEFSFLFTACPVSDSVKDRENEKERFFPLFELPHDLIKLHLPIAIFLQDYSKGKGFIS